MQNEIGVFIGLKICVKMGEIEEEWGFMAGNFVLHLLNYTPFTNSKIQANFEQDLINITKADIPMGLREAILEDVKRQGIEQGIEQGAAAKEKTFVHTLWSLQEFSFEKMAILVGTTEEHIHELILELLRAEGKTEEDSLQIIADYQKKFMSLND